MTKEIFTPKSSGLAIVKMRKHKCVIEKINIKKSMATFTEARILALILVYQYQNLARYTTDINFLLTFWYQIIVQTKMIYRGYLSGINK